MSPKKENLPIYTESESQDGGTITYANEVIAIIAGIAASEVDGIAGMCTSGGIGDIIGRNRNITRGVKVEVGTEEVSVDLYSIIEYGKPIQKVASEAQENVRKSIESMTGLKVVKVDVHVQGVSFEKEKREAQSNLASANLQSLPEAHPFIPAEQAAQEEALSFPEGEPGQAQLESRGPEFIVLDEETSAAEGVAQDSPEISAAEAVAQDSPEIPAAEGVAQDSPEVPVAEGVAQDSPEVSAPTAEPAPERAEQVAQMGGDGEEKAALPEAKPAKKPRKASGARGKGAS